MWKREYKREGSQKTNNKVIHHLSKPRRDVKLEILKSQKQMEHEKVVFPDNNPLTQIFQIVVGDKHH